MQQYDWPGNIRELENVIRKLIVFRDPDLVVKELRTRMSRQWSFDRLQSGLSTDTSGPTKRAGTIMEQVTRAKNEAESAAIIAALESTHWNRKKAATILKLDYKALLYKMKRLGIEDRTAIVPQQMPVSKVAAVAAGS
jgi:two-component system response regulator AtoC